MTKMQIKKLKTISDKIGKKRDEIRKLLGEYTDIVDSIQTACNELDEAQWSLENAIDSLSEHV